jgi:hypothetical protein
MKDLFKSTPGLSKKDLRLLREKFVNQYIREKNWNKDKLTPSQLLEIVENSLYKDPQP